MTIYYILYISSSHWSVSPSIVPAFVPALSCEKCPNLTASITSLPANNALNKTISIRLHFQLITKEIKPDNELLQIFPNASIERTSPAPGTQTFNFLMKHQTSQRQTEIQLCSPYPSLLPRPQALLWTIFLLHPESIYINSVPIW